MGAGSTAVGGLHGAAEAPWREIDAADEDGPDAAEPAWAWALACARWAAGISPPPASPPDGDGRALARGGWVLARGAFAAKDLGLLDAWVGYGERLGVEPGITALLRAFRALAHGQTEEAATQAHAAATAARGSGAAALLVEAEALRALALLEARRAPEAREIARRASRMGRTESLPQSEYLAGIALARVRRWEGRPHHAARILSSLTPIAPEPWRGWAAAELWLCGDTEGARKAAADERTPIGQVVARWLAGRPLTQALPWAPIARIEAEVEALLDPEAPAAGLADWRHGGELPQRYRGLSLVGTEDEPVGAPWIHLRPGAAPARLLALGLQRTEAPRARAPRRQRRTTQALAALALAGPRGLSREELFRRVYGFTFKAVTHQGSLDVLMHRVRDVIAPFGEIQRTEGEVQLLVDRPCLLEDEPGETPLEDLVLRTIATHPGHGARELATELGVALRTMQTLLAQLAAEGLCEATKDGRRLTYRVEDTTFSEPTRAAAPPPV